jgi:trans-aconitate 2-methyltransferase
LGPSAADEAAHPDLSCRFPVRSALNSSIFFFKVVLMADSWNPGQYDKFKNERSQPFYDLMDLIPKDSCFAKVIDLGCGSGELTAVLHERFKVFQTLGIDNSTRMLEKAPTRDGLQFKNASIETLDPFEKYDLVFSNAALQWCFDHPAHFGKLKHNLNDGGQLAVQMPINQDYPTHVIARELASEEPYRSLLKNEEVRPELLKPEEYAALLFKLGFRESTVLVKVYGHVLPSREDVIEWVRGTMLTPYESQLGPEHFANFVAEFRRRLFEVLKDDQPFFYPFKRLLMWARL